MTYARRLADALCDTMYFLVTTCCVRHNFLLGFDPVTRRDYSHRKAWVVERLYLQAQAFAVDVCTYSVMSNHYHLTLAVAQDRAKEWSQEEVVQRWSKLFKVPPLVQRWVAGQASPVEAIHASEVIDRWRKRLYDISWYMRCLNQHVAERANKEDGVKGRFWNQRFHSQALLDDQAVLSAMAYVDLNPMRAGMTATPEEPECTSIYQRIQELLARKTEEIVAQHPPLRPFKDEVSAAASVAPTVSTIPCRFEDYLVLLDWTGRSVRPDKRGAIDASLPPIMQRLGIDASAWVQSMRPHGNVFGRAMGRLEKLRLHAQTLGQSWIRGLRQARLLYGAQPMAQ